MKVVLRGDCDYTASCQAGPDPSYAWSPDGRRLAVAANPARGPTLLKILDRDGRPLRSFTLPRFDRAQGGRAFFRLVSWSPDGARLLLIRSAWAGFIDAAVGLDVATGRSRVLTALVSCEYPRLAWSPDGRYVALATSGTQDCLDRFEVIDAASAKAIVRRSWNKTLGQGGTVWATDSRSIFVPVPMYSFPAAGKVQVSSRIDRVFLDGRRAITIGTRAGLLLPLLALNDALIYQTTPRTGYGRLFLHSLAGAHDDVRFSSRRGVDAVLPLARLP